MKLLNPRNDMKKNKTSLSDKFSAFASTIDTLKAEEILEYRDKSFINYHTHKTFLDKIERKFGQKALDNIKDMTKVNLKRKIIDNRL